MRYLLFFLLTFNIFAQFEIPTKLKPRVVFWVDIFTKYGKTDLVFHHRQYPQAVFNVADLGKYAEQLSEREFKSFKETVDKSGTKVIYRALRKLADGERPITDVEKRVKSAMELVPGGKGKYQKVIDEQLVRTQTGIKERYADAVKKSGKYIRKMEKIFREAGLPIELTRLPFIESSFNYEAYSSVGAAGIWQFMPFTAKKYMIVSKAVDERRDPITATRAATKYLHHAYNVLGNWGLAVTSYNHGISGVKRKVNEFGSSDIGRLVESPGDPVFGFASGNFYAEFLAAVHIYQNLNNYFPKIVKEPELNFKEYQLQHSLSLSTISKTTGVSKDRIVELNLALLSPVIQQRSLIPAGFHLKVPVGADVDLRVKEPAVKKAVPAKSGKVTKTAKKSVTVQKKPAKQTVKPAKKTTAKTKTVTKTTTKKKKK